VLPSGNGSVRFAATAALVARIYGGYKLIQLIDRTTSGTGRARTAARYARHHRASAEGAYRLATWLEGLPIKVCQFLGTRADVLPPEYIDVLSIHREPEDFSRLSRDIYIPAGDMGFWQGAFRDPSDPRFIEVKAAIEERQIIRIDLLYEDHEGGQRTISRFSLTPVADDRWLTSVARHWNLDRDDPR